MQSHPVNGYETDTLHDYQCRQLFVSFPSASLGLALRTERTIGSTTPDLKRNEQFYFVIEIDINIIKRVAYKYDMTLIQRTYKYIRESSSRSPY